MLNENVFNQKSDETKKGGGAVDILLMQLITDN